MSSPMQADALEAAAQAIAGTEWDGEHDRPRFRREAEAAIRAYHEAAHAAEPAARALTCVDLADALECVWNAAIGESNRRQSDIGVASIIAESFQAVAVRLREISDSTSTNPAEPKVKAEPVAFLVDDFHVVRSLVKARGKFPKPDHFLYPANREADARDVARVMRGTCTPLYAHPPTDALRETLEVIQTIAEKSRRHRADIGKEQMYLGVIEQRAKAALRGQS